MKEKIEEESATSTIQRLIEKRKLTEEQYIGLSKDRFRTAEDRRINNFNELLDNEKDKKGK